MFTIAAFLIGAWFLGLMLSLTFNGMIHLLLVAGIVIVLGKIIHEMTPADHKQKTVGKGKGEMSNEAISGLRISSS